MRELKILFVVAAISAFVACSQTATNSTVATNTATANANSKPASNVTPGPPPTTEVASGAELYKTSCSKCHKEDGTGGKITVEGKQIDPDNLTTAKMAAKTDVQMTKYILEGFPEDGMPAFKGRLKDDDVKQIIAFIRSDLQKGVTPAPPANK